VKEANRASANEAADAADAKTPTNAVLYFAKRAVDEGRDYE